MSSASDAMEIVMELVEAAIGRVVLRDAKKFVEGKKTVMMDDTTNVAVAEDDKADWNAMMDSERTDMWWIDGGESDMINVADIKNNDEMKPVNAEQDDKISVDDGNLNDDGMRPAEAEQDDEIDVVVEDDGESEVIKLELPGYDRMNFNWKEVEPLYKGQSE